MQPVRQLAKTLEMLATEGEGLFALSDLRGALPDLSPAAFRVLVSRAEKQGLLSGFAGVCTDTRVPEVWIPVCCYTAPTPACGLKRVDCRSGLGRDMRVSNRGQGRSYT